jgi:hypothetical protein
MIMTFHTTCLVPHRFNAYLTAYAREGWAIERAIIGDCAGSYFVEIGPQQRIIQMWRHADLVGLGLVSPRAVNLQPPLFALRAAT